VAVDLPVAEEMKQPLDLVVADRSPQADAVDVVHRDKHRRLVRHPELVETASSPHDGLGLDTLDDPQTMIRVDDLVSDLECHVSPEL
jgi:hypothetical protein